MYQIFDLRQLVEKCGRKGKKLFVAFMDLEKAYDRIDREGMWKVLKMYGIEGKLLEAIKSFYDGSKACVQIDNIMSEWFDVKVGLRQGCVMSTWLFNLFMDATMKEVKRRMGDSGVELQDQNGRWKVSHLLYADDAALIAESESELREYVECFAQVCNDMKLKVNVGKSKIIVFEREGESNCEVFIGNERLEVVEVFKYLGSVFEKRGGCENDVNQRVIQGKKVGGIVRNLVKRNGLSVECARTIHEVVLVPTLLYGSETVYLKERDISRIRAVEMDCLRSIVGVRRMDRVRNADVRKVCGVSKGVEKKREGGLLAWYGHVERMNPNRVVKRISVSECVGNEGRGRPRKEWKDGVNECLMRGGAMVGDVGRLVRDRNGFRRRARRMVA